LFFYISMVEEYSLYLKNVFIFVHRYNVTIHFSDSCLYSFKYSIVNCDQLIVFCIVVTGSLFFRIRGSHWLVKVVIQ